MAQLGRWIILEAAWPASSLVPLCQTKSYQLIFDLINLIVILYIYNIYNILIDLRQHMNNLNFVAGAMRMKQKS